MLSAGSPRALRAQAARLREHMAAHPALRAADVAHALATTRAPLAHRAVVVGRRNGELLRGVAALAQAEPCAGLVEGVARDPGRTVFVFPGQGSQWDGMAVELWNSCAVFRERMQECAAALDPYVDWSLPDVVLGRVDDTGKDRVDVVQPVLWAVLVSLAELWRSYGVEPAAVVGHSQGEIAAACVAGALSLDDGARVVALRSRLIAERLAGAGGMVSLTAPVEEVRARLADFAGRLSLAAVNGPSSVVLSGDPTALDELTGACARDGVRTRRVAVDYASHSPHVEALRTELLARLADIRPRTGTLPLYSTVTGNVVPGEELIADYWYRNLRRTVRLSDAVERLGAAGHGTFVECSPHPVLALGLTETLGRLGREALVTGTLHRDDGGLDRFLLSLGEVYAGGRSPDWTKVFAKTDVRRVSLPTYAFDRQRYWLDATPPAGDVGSVGLSPLDHPFWGAVTDLPDSGGVLLTGRLSRDTHPWLGGHAVGDVVLLPGTAFLELAVRAAEQVGCDGVAELTLEAPLVLPPRGGVQLRAVVGPADAAGDHAITIHARPEHTPDGTWTRQAAGSLARTVGHEGRASHAWPPPGAEPVPVEGVYEDLAALSLRYGPEFRGLRAAWRRGTKSSPRSCSRGTATPTGSRSTRPCSTPRCTRRRSATPRHVRGQARPPGLGCRSRGPVCGSTRSARRGCGYGSPRWAPTPSRWRPPTRPGRPWCPCNRSPCVRWHSTAFDPPSRSRRTPCSPSTGCPLRAGRPRRPGRGSSSTAPRRSSRLSKAPTSRCTRSRNSRRRRRASMCRARSWWRCRCPRPAAPTRVRPSETSSGEH